jgi:SAM-dependent methyltransferase
VSADPYVGSSYSEAWARAHGTSFERLADPAVRRRKALKIAAVVADFEPRPLCDLRCIDVGCSAGAIASVLAERFGEVLGLDPDEPAIELARRRHTRGNLRFEVGTPDALAGRVAPADVIVCNHVYEHVHDQARLVESILGLLRPGGCVYFSAGNALMLFEGHYGLPFLSWLPPSAASAYLRLSGRGDVYQERHLTLLGLRRLLRRFEVRDYSVRVLAEPGRFAADELRLPMLPSRLVGWLAVASYPLLPTYVWMLRPR